MCDTCDPEMGQDEFDDAAEQAADEARYNRRYDEGRPTFEQALGVEDEAGEDDHPGDDHPSIAGYWG